MTARNQNCDGIEIHLKNKPNHLHDHDHQICQFAKEGFGPLISKHHYEVVIFFIKFFHSLMSFAKFCSINLNKIHDFTWSYACT